jgi:3',5'-cyclic AMP phosphodiesterase CpdA
VGESTVRVAAAGDIARRPDDGEPTADLIRALGPDAVLALGDTAYDDGSPEEFAENYHPTWGAFRAITRPIPGNHEYRTPEAAGYFEYFRRQIGDRAYYAWDAGPWRMYALNCEIDCGRSSEQVDWLTEDLARNDDKPALAYVHSPLYTCSTRHPPARRLDDIWKALLAGGGELVLSGDNHAYERFAPQDERGRPVAGGMRQFVVGTGGAPQYPLRDRCANREAENDRTDGVLLLDLEADRYAWQFVAVGGAVLDSGSQPLP